jgi:hypothetical protein
MTGRRRSRKATVVSGPPTQPTLAGGAELAMGAQASVVDTSRN